MVIYSYVVVRDHGFAPNPFYGYCTLATCKPKIRKGAQEGDWVIGNGSVAVQNGKYKNKLIYAMRVDEKISFDDYWDDDRFYFKRPIMNGSNKQFYGDNIYHRDVTTGEYIQENSHHSLENGLLNELNYNRDLKSEYVLISKTFWYYGENAICIPSRFKDIIKEGIGEKKITDEKLINKFIIWLQEQNDSALIGKPTLLSGKTIRYNGA
jgi:hypothetical protein